MTANDTNSPRLVEDLVFDPVSLLAWQLAMGVDEAIDDEPMDRFAVAVQTAAVPNRPGTATRNEASLGAARDTGPVTGPSNSGPRPVVAKPAQSITGASSEHAAALAAAATTLDELKDAMGKFDGGLLKRSAKNLVFSGGTAGAPVMVIGKAPDGEDDQQGTPFVGKSGRLLDKMLVAAGFSRDTNVYLTNLLPWRPLGNRTPDTAVVSMCLPFLQRHIELAAPKMIILLGGVSAQALLQSSDGITRLRGKWKAIDVGDTSIPCLPIYSPDYLMSQPHLKGLAWRDILAVKQKFSEISK